MPAGATFGQARLHADDAGRLALRLAYGRYELWLGEGAERRRGPAFDWGARGASPARLALDRP